MADVDAVRVDNFKESLRQANRYLALGLFSSLFLFALCLDPAAFAGASTISLPGGFPPLPVQYARIALALAYWVSPFLAGFSLARAERIGLELQQSNVDLLKAVISFPCIATTRVHGPRWAAALIPPLLVAVAGSMNGFFAFSVTGILLFFLSAAPYMVLFAFRLRRSIGGLAPDAQGD